MSLEKSLKLVASVKPTTTNIVVSRRQRLLAAINKQIALLNVVIDPSPDCSPEFTGRKPAPCRRSAATKYQFDNYVKLIHTLNLI